METIQVSAPKGHEIDVENSDLVKGVIVFKEKQAAFPVWEKLGNISGYYTNAGSKVVGVSSDTTPSSRNVFKTRSQAEASIALAQLTQLMAHVNGDWVPDWNKPYTKYCIESDFNSKIIEVSFYYHIPHFLTFKDNKTAQGFLTAYEDLIKQAAPLLWGVEF